MNMTQNELKLIMDGQDSIRESLSELNTTMQAGFQRVHTRIDDHGKRCDTVCINTFATKAELAYVDGRFNGVQGGINRVWQAVQLTAAATVAVGIAFALEHKQLALDAISKAWKGLSSVF